MHALFDDPTATLVPGGHRTAEPTETLRRIKPLLPVTGITRVANVTGMDAVGIPTVIVTRPNARSLSVSQGKGARLVDAKVSGIMESIEQWHAERIDRPLRLTSLAELAGSARVVDVDRLPRFVEPYRPTRRILWIQGVEVTGGEALWVPYEMVHLDLTLPLPDGSGHFVIGSNGLASGNCRLEALAHGLYEVIERDATTLFYLLPGRLQWERRLDLESVDDPICRGLLEAFDRADVEVAVWDTTSDLGVPSYLCSVLDRAVSSFHPVGLARGAGCSPVPAEALSRALTEAAQSRLTRIVGTRDDIQREDFESLQSDAKHEAHRAQMAAPRRPPLRFADRTGLASTSLHDQVSWACRLVEARGVGPVVAVDLSRPDFPIFVVRTIVPGLEASSEVRGYNPGARARRMSAEVGS